LNLETEQPYRGHCQLGGTAAYEAQWDALRVRAVADLYRGHRFPADVISQVVWLYFRFSVSYREVEEMMAWRGVQLTYETVREWCCKFGPYFAEELRRRNKRRLGSKWHLDEVFLKIKGVRHYLWRAVDQNGAVIDILVQPKRDRFAAERFFRKLLRRTGREPRLIVTDKLRSYVAANRRSASACRSSAKSISEQSSGELTSADATTRAAYEAFQIAAASTVVPLRL
jgi:putative transposase